MDGLKFNVLDDRILITIDENVSEKNIDGIVNQIFEFEKDTEKNCITIAKHLDKDLIVSVLKFAMDNNDLKDVSMLLNIINLINDDLFDDEFYNNEYIYFSSKDELIYVREKLKDRINDFRKEFALYFISLFKSYNKLMYEPLDKHIKLPKTFEYIFRSNDLKVLTKLFSISPSIDTKDCIYIECANEYLIDLLLREPVVDCFGDIFKE